MNIIRTDLHNSNNGLGYGGKVGKYTFYDNGLRLFKGKQHFEPSIIGKSANGYEWPSVEVEEWSVLFNDVYIHITGKPSANVYIYKKIPTKETTIYHMASFDKTVGDFLTLIKTIPFTL